MRRAENGSAFSPVAVVGYSCRLPGAPDIDSFWSLLSEKRCTVSPEGSGRWSNERFLHPRLGEPGRSYTFASGVLPDIYAFDHAAFGLSPREVEQMDPQQRILLELTREALEDMNLPAADLAGEPVGVFVGASSIDHMGHFFGDIASAESHFVTGSALSIIANRISHVYGLTGPSLTIDTACSSSMVALDRAVKAIEQGEIDTAIVGSVNVLAGPFNFIGFSRAGMLSPTGLCRPFSADADGYVRSEGAAIVVLRRLDVAQAAGQTPRAVIMGSGVNSDGHTVGIVFPASEAQQRLVETLYGERGIDIEALSFVEAHGTGTRVGDPAEARALGLALGQKRSRPLPVGSVKSNIGHLEPASGLAGLLKSILALQHKQLPASLHLDALNETIPFAEYNLVPARDAVPLVETGGSLSAGVSSFGFGGTNAHVALRLPTADEMPTAAEAAGPVQALALSAHTRQALGALARRYAEVLATEEVSPAQVARAAAYGRDLLPHRLITPLEGARPLHETLQAYADDQPAPEAVYGRADTQVQRIAFVFSGNGSQFVGMGRAAYAASPGFRDSIARLDATFVPLAGWSLADAIKQPLDAERLASTTVAQPLIFAIEVAIAEGLIAAGCRPAFVLGHSVGEVAAATVAGCLTRDDAVRLIFWRSHWQETTRGQGAMLALMRGAADAEALIQDLKLTGLSVAALNSPAVVSIAGPRDSLDALQRAARNRRIAAKPLGIDYPFHSALMDPIREPLLAQLASLRPEAGTIPFISTVTGEVHDPLALGAAYWWRNVRDPVRFQAAVEAAAAAGADLFVEIAPRTILVGAVKETLAARAAAGTVISALDNEQDGRDPLMRCILHCLAQGAPIAPETLFGSRPRPNTTRLPLYPWQRTELRPPDTTGRIDIIGRTAPHPLLGRRLSVSSHEWQGLLDTALVPYLADHRVNDTVVVPGAALVEMALAAGRDLFGEGPLSVEDFDIVGALVLRDDSARETLVRVSNGRSVEILSRERGREDWTLHARGRIGRTAQAEPGRWRGKRTRGGEIDGAELYRRAEGLGLAYGPQFRLVERARRNKAVIEVDLAPAHPAQGAYRVGHVLHPVMLDAAFHGLLALVEAETPDETRAFLPVRFGRLDVWSGGEARRAVVTIRRASARSILADISLLDADGEIFASLEEARFRWTVLSAAADERPAYLQRIERMGGDPGPATGDRVLELLGRHKLSEPPSDDRILLQAFTHALAFETIRGLAAKKAGRTTFRFDAALQNGQIAADAQDMVALLLHSLDQAGIAREQDGTWTLDPAAALPRPGDVLRAVLETTPDRAAEVALASRLAAELAAMLRTGRPLAAAAGILDHFMAASPTFAAIGAFAAAFCDDFAEDAVADRPHVLLLEAHGTLGRALAPLVRRDRIRLTVDDLGLADRTTRSTSPRSARMPGIAVGLDEAKQAGTRFDLLIVLDQDGSADFGRVKEAAAALHPGAPVLTLRPSHDAFVDLVLAAMPDPRNPERMALSGRRAQPDLIDRLRAAGLSDLEVVRIEDARAACDVAVGITARALAPDAALPALADTLAAWLDGGDDTLTLNLDPGPDGGGKRTVVLHKQPKLPPKQMSERLARRIERAAALLDDLRGHDPHPEVWFVTRRAQPLCRQDEDISEAGFWGFGRVAINENADMALRLVDIAGGSAGAVATTLATLLSDAGRDREIVIDAQGPHAVRVEAARAPVADSDPERAAVLGMTQPGSLSRLSWQSATRRAPGRGEVEIAVAASALNFRDVMFAQGLLGDDMLENGFAGPTLGFECAGLVERVGEGVTATKPGDRVMAFASAAFATHVTVSDRALVVLPEDLDLVAAATMPVAFLTVWYGLDHLARLKRGETILIHGATGGVGLAALQIARLKGAKIVATAGNPEKRALARMLGAHHVFDSRSQAFADEVMRKVGGVDVVLNSLAGEAMERSLKLLKPFGRFVELGKRDYVANSEIGLRPFARNLTYFGVDADQLVAADPKLVPQMFGKLRRLIEAGAIHPLPYRSFEAADVADAFRLMQGGGHIGKILIRPPTAVAAAAPAMFQAASDGVHLVVGGTGGFGFETAAWLAERGARTIVVASRSGELDEAAQARVTAFAARGVTVEARRLDVRNRAETLAFVGGLEARHGRLRGVVHAAMILHDGLIRDLDPAHLRETLAPKIQGALNLDDATGARNLDYFVLYSSATTLIGNPGQGAYVAANAAMESLARRRRSRGLPALAVGWGPITDVGVLARNAAVSEKLQRRIGAVGLKSHEALAFLGRVLGADPHTSPPVVTYAPLDFASIADLPTVKTPMFADLVQSAQTTPDQAPSVDLGALIANKSDAEATAALAGELAKEIGRILHLAPADVDHRRPLTELGMDSLMGLELEMEVQRRFGVQLPLLSLSAGATLIDVSSNMLKRLRTSEPEVVGANEPDNKVVSLSLASRHLSHEIEAEHLEDMFVGVAAEAKRTRQGGLIQ